MAFYNHDLFAGNGGLSSKDETAAYFAFDVLAEGGTFVAKVLAGGAEGDLQKVLKQNFQKVAHMKPPSSRSDSSEKFVVATGFKGRNSDDE